VDEPRRRERARSLPVRIARRFLHADGTSHMRALAYSTMFVMISGFIGLLGLASLLDVEEVRGVVVELGKRLSPGPSGDLIEEAARSGARHATAAAIIGLAAAVISGTIAMAQIERTGNRLVGSDRDRRLVPRFVIAFVLAVTAGLVFAAGGMALGAGRAIPTGTGWSDELRGAWSVARWPVGVLVVSVAILLLFRFAPRSSLGPWRSLIWGTVVAVVLWVAFTGLLSLYFSLSSDSTPYGPLLSIVALLLWSMLGSFALGLGMATSAELSHARRPEDEHVVTIPEPELETQPESEPQTEAEPEAERAAASTRRPDDDMWSS
jgi:YihY family inner membrane protein